MSGDIENKLIKLVEGITLRPVGPDELLLDSGLVDSISAVDLVLQMESELGIDMPAERIHEHMRTVRTLTSYALAFHR